MLQLLPKSDILTPNTASVQETVDFISSYIDKYHCETLEVDISYMNLLDACYVTTMCGAKHFIKYPDGKINWVVSSVLVDEFTKSLNLGNSIFSI